MATCHMTPLTRNIKNRKASKPTSGCQGAGGEGGHCLMGPLVSIWGHETVPELDSHDGCSTLKMYLMSINCIL